MWVPGWGRKKDESGPCAVSAKRGHSSESYSKILTVQAKKIDHKSWQLHKCTRGSRQKHIANGHKMSLTSTRGHQEPVEKNCGDKLSPIPMVMELKPLTMPRLHPKRKWKGLDKLNIYFLLLQSR